MRTWCILLLMPVGIAAAEPSGGSAPLPALAEIREAAVRRESAFDNYDARFDSTIHNPGRESPLFVRSGRFVKQGEWQLVDLDDRAFYQEGQETLNHWTSGFDGTTARTLFRESQKGKISQDFRTDYERSGYRGPEALSVVIPESGGRTLSEVIADKPLLAFGSLARLSKEVSVRGREVIDGMPVIHVEVKVSGGRDQQEIHDIFLAEEHGYAVKRVDHWYADPQQGKRLNSRLDNTGFTDFGDGSSYPPKGTYTVFQGGDEPKQTTRMELVDFKQPITYAREVFRPEFPPGTHVFDTIVGTDYVAGGERERLPDGTVVPERLPPELGQFDTTPDGSAGEHTDGVGAAGRTGGAAPVALPKPLDARAYMSREIAMQERDRALTLALRVAAVIGILLLFLIAFRLWTWGRRQRS